MYSLFSYCVFKVLYADGTVSVHTGHWDLPRSRDSSPQRQNSGRSQAETPTKDKKAGKLQPSFSTDLFIFSLCLPSSLGFFSVESF